MYGAGGRVPGALASTTGCLFNKWLVVRAMRGTVMGVHFQSQGHRDRVIRTPHDGGELQSLVELLRWRAQEQPQQRAYTFLVDGEAEAGHLTYGELDQQARAIAAHLQAVSAPGERAVLLYQAGLEYIAAF